MDQRVLEEAWALFLPNSQEGVGHLAEPRAKAPARRV